MKLISLFLLIVLIFVSCHSGTELKYNTIYRLKEYGNLKSLKQSKKPFHFRYSVENVELDIFSEDSIHFSGKVFCYTVRHDKKSKKYYGINFRVSDSIANRIVQEFTRLSVSRFLLVDTAFLHQHYCSHCKRIDYEYSNGREYLTRYQYQFQTIKILDSFTTFIEENIDSERKFYEFIDYLPVGRYQHGGNYVINTK